jgi:hypothetical protein
MMHPMRCGGRDVVARSFLRHMEVPVKHSSTRLSWTWIAASALVAIGFGCAGVKSPSDGAGGSGTRPGAGGHGVTPTPCNGPGGLCTDFPTAPDVAPGVSTSFCASPSGAGPCIVEPEDGTLFPNNWLRPRVTAQGISGPMKITIHSDKEANDWVIYTNSNSWKMGHGVDPRQDQNDWLLMAPHLQGAPVTVTVCGATGGSSMTHFNVAPVAASGSMVFWAANPASADIDQHACQTSLTATCLQAAQLLGFSVGDESTEPVLTIGQVAQPSRTDGGKPAPVTCIGCHSATPDKGFVTFADSYPWRTATASVQGPAGVVPSGGSYPTVTPAGLAALLQPGWGPFSFSLNKSDTSPLWQPGMRIGVGGLGLKDPLVPDPGNFPDRNDSPHLAWFNLEAPVAHVHQNSDQTNWDYPSYTAGAGIDSGNSLGFIEHTGDMCGNVPCGAAMPSFSHDGSKIVYVSTNAVLSGRFNQEATGAPGQDSNAQRAAGLTNLYSVPFNGGLGGAATPIDGAATPDYEEYYPALSPDDQLVAFTRVRAGETMYANPNAELYVVKTGGGSANHLVANNPPACTGKLSPGVNNHWAKWSPDVASSGGSKYYWMIFSSNRADIPPQASSTGRQIKMSQLYLAPVVIDETQGINSYPAIYLWNQPTTSVNTTPAWETFEIAIIP